MLSMSHKTIEPDSVAVSVDSLDLPELFALSTALENLINQRDPGLMQLQNTAAGQQIYDLLLARARTIDKLVARLKQLLGEGGTQA